MTNQPLLKQHDSVAEAEFKYLLQVVPGRQDVQINSRLLPEILFITSYPPRECGIATYSQDLISALNNKFNHSFKINICALESEHEIHTYTADIKYTLNTDEPAAYIRLAKTINENINISIVLIQHEFGLFKKNGNEFTRFLEMLIKPVITVFHTVLPGPNDTLKENVQQIAAQSESIIVMTNSSVNILIKDYSIAPGKITLIPHGTHLVQHADKELLKLKYSLSGKKILSTFGLLSSGKSIETTLEALPGIIETNPDVLFLIIGKTHPSVVKQDGEKYRDMLNAKVAALQIEQHVKFINAFLPLNDLLEYLQLTDIYLFTSRDQNQAVSGTFSYAVSCGCPVISTPIPHAREVLQNDAGIIFDFENPVQLADAVISLLTDERLRNNISSNGIHRMASTAWENTAIAHGLLFKQTGRSAISLQYKMPPVNLAHIKKLTTDFGMIQFSKINQPDITSGYTLDDNARAMIAMCQHFELSGDEEDLQYIGVYLNFIQHCQQTNGSFLNYVNDQKDFSEQNNTTNLADSNGRAVWALGYLISLRGILPENLSDTADILMQRALQHISSIHSTRAMAFAIKGLYYYNSTKESSENISLIKELANRLVQMYRHEMDEKWLWFERYLTYANSILPEAMLCAWLATGEKTYRDIAGISFDFLLSKTFSSESIKVISNDGWLHKGNHAARINNGGQQPIDVAYTILALSKFYSVFKEDHYLNKLKTAFNWFLGNNHLQQVIYNPCTGGCYDGLEENCVNLNQGAESTVSYLMARLTTERILDNRQKEKKLFFHSNHK